MSVSFDIDEAAMAAAEIAKAINKGSKTKTMNETEDYWREYLARGVREELKEAGA